MDKKPKKNKKNVAKKALPKGSPTHAKNPQVVSLIDKAKSKNEKLKTKNKVYYSFLTIVLLICLIQIGFGAILNISKTISYQTKIITMRKTRNEAQKINNQLKQDVKNFSSTASLEAIARNNLKMAQEDEVLIIINSNQNQEDSLNKKKGQYAKQKR